MTTKSCTSSSVQVGLQLCFTTELLQLSLATVTFLSATAATFFALGKLEGATQMQKGRSWDKTRLEKSGWFLQGTLW